MSTTTGQRISEVSARTGFSASALRFYEGAGLVEPGRTPAGYRIYDERSVERLRFIARAKGLGLSLDDIGELLPAWEGQDCADVAGHFAARVGDKVEETRARIGELAAFAEELAAARHRLVHGVTDGPCGDSCACAPDAESGVVERTAAVLGAKPSMRTCGDGVPIACTLNAGEAVERVGDWRRLLAQQSGEPMRRVEGGRASVTVWFGPDPTVAARAAELAASEQACCAFIDFTLSIDTRGIELTATTSVDGAPVLDALLGVPA